MALTKTDKSMLGGVDDDNSPSSLVERTPDGRVKVSDGVDPDDAVSKGQFDTELKNLTTFKILPNSSNISAGMKFIPDNGTTACSYNLPTTPNDGDTFAFIASETLFSVNTMTLTVTDKNINGDATSLVVDVDGFCGFVVYRAAVNEWRIYQDGSIGITA